MNFSRKIRTGSNRSYRGYRRDRGIRGLDDSKRLRIIN